MDAPSAATVPQLPLAALPPLDDVRWFCPWGCVAARGDLREVWIGGTLIGQFDVRDRDRGCRNVLLVALARDPRMHLGRLAEAFGLTDENLRLLRRKAEADGLGAVFSSRLGGRPKVTAPKRAQLRAWFAEGLTPTEAYRRQGRRGRLSRATMSRERAHWQAEKIADDMAATVTAVTAAGPAEEGAIPVAVAAPQLRLWSAATTAEDGIDEVNEDEAAVAERGDDSERHAPAEEPASAPFAAESVAEPVGEEAAGDEQGPIVPMRSRPVQSGRSVQHLGTWLMMGLAQRHGLYEAIASSGGRGDQARIAADATIAALAIGEGCVEGVRRLQTPTGARLLRAERAPTASAVRRRLWKLAEKGGAELSAAMSSRYIAAARAEADCPAVFYVDNHLRPYTGKEVVRKGWRMQDRRVLPGTSDYYVHDEDGRPVFRIDVASHDSLAKWLSPIGERLRGGLGPDDRILLAFDRGGAFAEQMAALRDADIEFVTYERRPFPLLAESAFDRTVLIRGEVYRAHESRLKNLRSGRGRVRRIALRASDGAQINLLASSKEPLERLVAILAGDEAKDEPSGRWQQENAFKHGVERWSSNQLDGRKVAHYPPDTVIPNPARRRIDRALRLARADEGAARCALAQLSDDHPKRERVERDLVDAVARRVQLELLRPFLPKHAPLAQTELAGKLVHHTGELKAVVDTIRIVCANAESELAGILAPQLRRGAEAKKVIANLLVSPGSVQVSPDAIRIRLAPAANRSERAGIEHLLAQVNRWKLTLPGDPQSRPLRFELQTS